MKTYIYMAIGLATLTSCAEEIKSEPVSEEVDYSVGKELMIAQCYTCHNTQGTDNMLAPPMQRVKDHYLDEGTTEEEFVQAFVEWCKNPNEEDSRMPGARRNFGLMPKPATSEEDVATIARYIFHDNTDLAECEQGCHH